MNLHKISFFKELLDGIDDKQNVIDFVKINILDLNITRSVKIRKLKTFVQIYNNNDSNDVFDLFVKYYNSSSNKEKYTIKHGEGSDHIIDNIYKSRKRPNKIVSQFTIEYWMNKGYSQEDSIQKISEIQKEICIKSSITKNKNKTYQSLKYKNKISVHYWTSRGYSVEEALILREPFLKNCKNDLDSLIEKYGEKVGTQKHKKKMDKLKLLIQTFIPNRRTGGYVSKESIKFFIPIYKFCRKLGLKRNEIYFGIKGSREYFIIDKTKDYNTGCFYDFCIPKLNLIVEYNGYFWHPTIRENWKNKFIDFDEVKIKDINKEMLAKNVGFKFIVVWDNIDVKLQQYYVINLIRELYDEFKFKG